MEQAVELIDAGELEDQPETEAAIAADDLGDPRW